MSPAARDPMRVEIPAGIGDRQTMRVAGAGRPGEPGGRPGDLYVEVRVAEDERFQRDGDDLVSISPSSTEAMLGMTSLGPEPRRRARDRASAPGFSPAPVRAARPRPTRFGGGRRGDLA